jgi:hypothetical protein
VALALVRTRCGLLKCVAQHGVHEMFALVGAKCTPGGTCSDLDGRPYGRYRPPRRARKFVNESGRTREAEGATTSAKTARPFRSTSRTPDSAPRQVLASRQECQAGRCGCLGRLLFFEGEVVGARIFDTRRCSSAKYVAPWMRGRTMLPSVQAATEMAGVQSRRGVSAFGRGHEPPRQKLLRRRHIRSLPGAGQPVAGQPPVFTCRRRPWSSRRPA